MAIKPVELTKIKAQVPNLYEAVIVASNKARKINDQNKLEFNKFLSEINVGGDDELEERENPEQLKLSLEFDKREKPHIQAIKELLEKGIEHRYKDR